MVHDLSRRWRTVSKQKTLTAFSVLPQHTFFIYRIVFGGVRSSNIIYSLDNFPSVVRIPTTSITIIENAYLQNETIILYIAIPQF